MALFLKLVGILARYGRRAVDWAWANRGFVIWLIGQVGLQAAINWILKHLGLG